MEFIETNLTQGTIGRDTSLIRFILLHDQYLQIARLYRWSDAIVLPLELAAVFFLFFFSSPSGICFGYDAKYDYHDSKHCSSIPPKEK